MTQPQGELLKRDVAEPEAVVAEALEAEGPVVRTFCLLSGGHDSTTCAHRTRELYDELAFIDTGTALPGVVEFVHDFAGWIGKPLRVLDSGTAYEELVLGDRRWWDFFAANRRGEEETLVEFVLRTTPDRRRGDGHGNAPQGFPGPGGGHRAAYARLKERKVEELIRETKAELAPGDRMARVALLSGARRHESRRRAMTQGVDGFRRRYAQVWVNPLNEWTNPAMHAYRREHAIPESDVAALLHRSGECNCGAYMAVGEIADVKALFPEWYRYRIEPLERRARELGIPRCVWGERTDTGRPGARGFPFGEQVLDEQLAMVFDDDAPEGLLCSDCAGALAA